MSALEVCPRAIILHTRGWRAALHVSHWANSSIRIEESDNDSEAADLSLSHQQRGHFARWGRPDDALPPPVSRKLSGHRPSPPTMVPTRPTDFVQDVATDCSVVASLSAIMARVNRGYDNVSRTALLAFSSHQNIADPRQHYLP